MVAWGLGEPGGHLVGISTVPKPWMGRREVLEMVSVTKVSNSNGV
jgi:hypothetical protein